jgi:hypothetical protein
VTATRAEHPGDDPDADVAIVASARATAVRFHARPQVATRFPGTGQRESTQVTTRRNVADPVEPGVTYEDVRVATRIASRKPA